jgi:Ricin-type beta-trefoil lectin domain-like
MIVANITVGTPIAAPAGNIPFDTTMAQGQWAISANNEYVLIMQGDGNLVLYQVIGAPPVAGSSFHGNPLWSSQTTPLTPVAPRFVLQSDGNMVVYNGPDDVLWQSETYGVAGLQLSLQTDGNLVMYDTANQGVFATNTNHSQLWPLARWGYLLLPPTGPDGDLYALTAGMSSLTISPMQANTPSQLWQLTADGRFISGLLNNLVLTQDAASALNSLQSAPAAGNQTWTWSNSTGYTTIQNNGSGQYLSATGNGATVTVEDAGQPTQWYLTAVSPLDMIMSCSAASPGYPAFDAPQQDIYAYTNRQLGIDDLRTQYANPSAPLDTYPADIANLDYSSFPAAVAAAVLAQLQAELGDATVVQTMFTNYTTFHGELVSLLDTTIDSISSSAGFASQDTPVISVSIPALLFSVIDDALASATAINGATAYSVAANILHTAINIATGTNRISMAPVQMSSGDLANALNQAFTTLRSTVQAMTTTVTSNWASLQLVAALTMSDTPDTLQWVTPVSTLPVYSLPGFSVAILQMLLPTSFQIYQCQANDSMSLASVPSYAQHVASDGSGYWIASTTDSSTYPTEAAMALVWNNGVSAADFYTCNRGWAFAISGPPPAPSTQALNVAIANASPNVLVVTASCAQGTLLSPATQTLAPYATIPVSGMYAGGLEIDVQVFDPSSGAEANTAVAAFHAHQHKSVLEAGDAWVDTISTAYNYQMTTPACYNGAINSATGSVQASIYLAQGD